MSLKLSEHGFHYPGNTEVGLCVLYRQAGGIQKWLLWEGLVLGGISIRKGSGRSEHPMCGS